MIPSGGAYCENGVIYIYALNTGYDSSLIGSSTDGGDFILATIDGQNNITAVEDVTLAEGAADLVFQSDCGGDPGIGCGPGYHTVRLGTQSTIVDPRISC